MPCYELHDAAGRPVGHICVRGRRKATRCHVEGCTQPAIWECDGHRYPCNPETGKPRSCDKPLCRKHGTQIAEEIHLCAECRYVVAPIWADIRQRILNVGEPSLALSAPLEGERWPDDPKRPHLLIERRACRVWLIDGGEAWSAYRSPDLQWELEKLPGVISLA